MTSEQQDKIHAARQFVVDGRTDEAIDALAVVVAGSEDWSDILLLLKTRHKNLNRSILKGTIAHEHENLERNGINSALFDLVQSIEHELETPEPELRPTKTPPPVVRPKVEPPPVVRPKADPPPQVPEPPAPATPMVVFGWKMAAGLSVAVVLVFLFFGKNWFGKTGGDGPSDIKTTAAIAPKIIKFSGKALRPNGQPAPGIQIEIGDGLAKTMSAADGSFEFSLPEMTEKKVRLVLRRDGQVLDDDLVGLTPAVFAEIKVPN